MGDRDSIVPLANGKILNALIPGSRLEVIEDGGHLFMVAQADKVVSIIEEFLDMPINRKAKKAA
jgi:pimeloyl-ACP methyl ester carboxylesterase